jgi:hypothetical protein
MRRSAFPIRTVGVVGAVVILALVMAGPVGALPSLFQEVTPEPSPRPSPTPSPYIEVNPTEAVAQNNIPITVRGFLWSTAAPVITIFLDTADAAHRLAGPGPAVYPDGSFSIAATIPAALATVGNHQVIATDNQGFSAQAAIHLTPPPPTPPPPQPGLVLNPTQGVAGNDTRVTATGSLWVPGQVVTFYWDGPGGKELGTTQVAANGTIEFRFRTPTKGSLAGVGGHVVSATAPNGQAAQAVFTLIQPTVTPTPSPTLSPTPSPTLAPITPMVTITPIRQPTRPPSAATSTPVRTRTPTPLPGTATFTPTPTHTPGPGTPSVTPISASAATATPVGETPETGAGLGLIFLWGFVLASLVVVFRVLRVSNLGRRS